MIHRQLSRHSPLTSNQVLKNMHHRRGRHKRKQSTRQNHGPATVGDIGKNIRARAPAAQVGCVGDGVEADEEGGALEVYLHSEAEV